MIDKFIGQKVLITCDWFIGPEGKDHAAVWGTLIGVHEANKHLGFTPNRAHANWFYEIGDVVIMGCQVKYICLCPNQPETDGYSWRMREGEDAVQPYRSLHKILITR